MSRVDRVLNSIKHLTVQEIVQLTNMLQTDPGKPLEHSRVGARPKRPRPSLRGSATAIPEPEKQELIKAIAAQQK